MPSQLSVAGVVLVEALRIVTEHNDVGGKTLRILSALVKKIKLEQSV